jgi:hypothetical protein
MFVTKKFDTNNIDNFKPCNQTIGNASFFKGKISKLPDYYYDVLEARSRIEYSDEDRQIAIDRALQEKKQIQQKLIDELLDRETHVIGENAEIISKPILYGSKTKL